MKALNILALVLLAIPSVASATTFPGWSSTNPVPAGAKVSAVRADLARKVGTWTGVRSCDRIERSTKPFRRAFANWLGAQVLAHPRQSLGKFGYQPGTVWYENRTRDNRRSCKAGFSNARVFAEFY